MAEKSSDNWVQLQQDVKPLVRQLDQAATTVRDENVSNYPIFVAYDGDNTEKVPGLYVLNIPTNRGVNWTVNVTTLEELVAKQIVTQDRINPFRKVYKGNADSLCFLIIEGGGARFGFVPK